jgi:hypothetical protein
MIKKFKKAQEEMIGFALIIIIIAVIILVFFSLSIRDKREAIESYEVENFLQAALQYNTDCEISYSTNFLDLNKLIKSCMQGDYCLNEKNSCEILNQTLKELISESWKIGKDEVYKGYSINITSSTSSIFSYSSGNLTKSYKGANQVFETYAIDLKIYF